MLLDTSLWTRLRVLYIALILLPAPFGTALLGQNTPAAATVTLDTPAPGATQLSGHAYGIDPNTTKVVIYALTNQWYVQPRIDAPFTNISADGSWQSSTNPWSSIVVLLVNPANYTPAATEITNPALDPGVLAWTNYPSGPVSVDFSGRTWGIKVTGNASGDQFTPGPNFWSNDPSVVNVAADGLHLKITQINGKWQCGEVYLTQSLGYGTYTVQVSSHLDQLDHNTVAAPLFIYAAPDQELDNEYSGAGGLIPNPYNAQFVVQPYTVSGNIFRYVQPSTAQFTSQIDWHADHVTFTTWNGWSKVPAAGDIIKQWTYTGSYIPPPGQERVRMNLWLLDGSAPVSGTGDEMVINSFTFQGSGTPTPTPVITNFLSYSGDFNGDGKQDILWRNTQTGEVDIWFMNGATVVSQASTGIVGLDWKVVGIADFNGDGISDILWQNTVSGNFVIWLMHGSSHEDHEFGSQGNQWSIVGAEDLDDSGFSDILWRNLVTGELVAWKSSSGLNFSSFSLGTAGLDWNLVGAANLFGSGQSALIWRNQNSGEVVAWQLSGNAVSAQSSLGVVPLNWTIAGFGDFNGDGRKDILWHNTSDGSVAAWLMNGFAVSPVWINQGSISQDWQIRATPDVVGNGLSSILWSNITTGEQVIWIPGGGGFSQSSIGFAPPPWAIIH